MFVCSSCGSKSPKWMGKCRECGEWNTYVEETEEKGGRESRAGRGSVKEMVLTSEVTQAPDKIPLKSEECTSVLGGGIVEGSLILLSGEP